MNVSALLIELFSRVPPLVEEAVDGLDADQLVAQPWEGANTIGWLGWHIGRVQDAQLAHLIGVDQAWVEGDWAARFGLEPDPDNSGYGHSQAEMLAVRPESSAAIEEYLAAVHARTLEFLGGLDEAALDAVVDRDWDPPVTLAVRLVSIADDCLQHAGQAAYARGAIG